MINKHKSNKIKENSNTVRHLNNGTDHRHSKSRCDQSSPARRTMTCCSDGLLSVRYPVSSSMTRNGPRTDALLKLNQRRVWSIDKWSCPHKTMECNYSPCLIYPTFNGGFVKLPLKSGHGLLIALISYLALCLPETGEHLLIHVWQMSPMI